MALIAILAFLIRIQSLGPTFHEFDPYYYMYVGRQLVVLGEVPHSDNTAWYPYETGHGNILLTGYLGAGWFEMYTGGGGYDNYLLSTITNIYPPLVGALICFFIYLLLKEEYGKYVGILGAGLAAFTPRLIEKFAAGEAEIMPWGLFSTFFFMAAFGLAVSRNDRRLAVLAGIAYMGTTFGSAYGMVVSLIMVGYVGLETVKCFIRGEDLGRILGSCLT
ncbi:MAG: hypothetical protein NT157_01805, partial [Candidatus Micrarchaeota archaeon]|nr:hypothetical protein [Candidatus Micrarchaeota archaeon]